MTINEEIQKRAKEIQASHLTKRVKEIQTSMVRTAESRFDGSELEHLRAVIRLTVEFRDYLENGSVEIAASILHGPLARYVTDARSASTDPFNRYDLEYACESIRSGGWPTLAPSQMRLPHVSWPVAHSSPRLA
jgi:hypothetical protein